MTDAIAAPTTRHERATTWATFVSASLFFAPLLAWATLGPVAASWLARVACIVAAAAAITMSSLVAGRAPLKTPLHRSWLILLTALVSIFGAEVLAAALVLTDMLSSIAGTLVLSVVQTAAAALVIGVVVLRGAVAHMGWQRFARLSLDGAVITIVISDGFLWYGTAGQGIFSGSTGLQAVVQGILAAICVLAGSSAVAFLVGRRRVVKRWEVCLLAGLLLISWGLALLRLTTMLSLAGGLRIGLWMVSEMMLVAGCLMVFVGAFRRWIAADWSTVFIAPTPTERSVWPSIGLSSMVFAAAGWLALSVALRTGDTPGRTMQLVSLSLVTFCMVARTAVANSEMKLLREFATTDALSGAFDIWQMNERMQELLTVMRRFGDNFMVAIVAVGSQSIPTSNSYPASQATVDDGVLRMVASSLNRQACAEDAVFRLSGHEFVILCPVASEEAANTIASQLLEAVNNAIGERVGVHAWLGYAICPLDAVDADALLACANGAEAWAKYLCSDRHVRYDKATMRVLGDEQCLGLSVGKPQMDIVHALSAAADARHPVNYGHSRNVATLSVLLAESIGFDTEHCERVRVAAILHDVGKLALADSVLDSVQLSVRDSLRVREHCILGSRLVESVALPGVSEWVRWHHERWDGAGYPDGLQGERIPIEARIIALADAYDAMTSGTRSTKGRSKAAALQEIDFGLGSRFDPELGEAFIAMVGTAGLLDLNAEWSAA